MKAVNYSSSQRQHASAFTLVEMLVVIAIMSVLMTAGAIGLGGMGGKGVTNGVAAAESLFDEARAMAVGKNLRTCVLVAKELTTNGQDNLRRILIASEESDSTTGLPKAINGAAPNWVLSNRGTLLPDQTYFSTTYSVLDQTAGSGALPTVEGSQLKSGPAVGSGAAPAVKSALDGSYYIYEFNSEGICENPGITFVIGAGTRGLTDEALIAPPKATKAGKGDFGGFAVWRNGRTSIFRSPAQISSAIKDLKPGDNF